MRVPPEAESRHFPQILVADIKASGESHSSIDDDDFAVIAHVDLNVTTQGIQGKKGHAFASGFPKRLQHATAERPRSHSVIHEPDLDALLGFFGQKFEEGSAGFVSLENKIFQVHMMASGVN